MKLRTQIAVIWPLFAVMACATGQTHIGRAVNVYTDVLQKYNTLCRPEVLPPGFKVTDRCRNLYTLLAKTKSDIAAADQALKLGGKSSPQQKTLDADIAALQKEAF